MKIKILIGLVLALILVLVNILSAYTPPSYTNVTLILNETAYVPPSYDDVTLVLETAAAPPIDSCSCPSPAANWYMDISDNCNVTTDCDNKGFNVHFENGTTGDMVNCSAMIVADNFYMDDAGSGAIVQTDPACYLNTTT